jgi:hypothetical protein
MMMVPKEMQKVQVLKIFENGTRMHTCYQTWLEKIGILVEAERKLDKGAISGHCDAIVKTYPFTCPKGQETIIEFKSAANDSFNWMQKKKKPKTEHYLQIMFYMYLSGIHQGIIFVENKDSQETLEFPITYRPETGKQLYDRANYLIDLAKKRKLPDRPQKYVPSCYKCSICDYAFYCHNQSIKRNGEVRYPIPFRFGTPAYIHALEIIDAVNNHKPIPDVIKGNTLGDLYSETAAMNQ